MQDDVTTHLVVFQPSGRQGQLPAGTTLLEAARRLGVDVDSGYAGRQTPGNCKHWDEPGASALRASRAPAQRRAEDGADEGDYVARAGWGGAKGGGVRGAERDLHDGVVLVARESE